MWTSHAKHFPMTKECWVVRSQFWRLDCSVNSDKHSSLGLIKTLLLAVSQNLTRAVWALQAISSQHAQGYMNQIRCDFQLGNQFCACQPEIYIIPSSEVQGPHMLDWCHWRGLQAFMTMSRTKSMAFRATCAGQLCHGILFMTSNVGRFTLHTVLFCRLHTITHTAHHAFKSCLLGAHVQHILFFLHILCSCWCTTLAKCAKTCTAGFRSPLTAWYYV